MFSSQTPQQRGREKYDTLLQRLEATKETAEEIGASEEVQMCLKISIKERKRKLRH